MIVGTAGHIDHGKSTLVRALTGVNTDRLKQEQERGISIELGYAYTALENGEVLGFIDVPGHERLIHTMVAGACGIDVALLVIAADDGIMPQTREHLAILELLGIQSAVVALTKVDRVDEPRRQAVRTLVTQLLAPTPFRSAPIFALNASAADDPGTQALEQYLVACASERGQRRDGAAGLFRLAVDRVFTLKGHGTIVTGTAFCGTVQAGATLAVMPADLRARVRSIHSQNRPAAQACAGERVALNLTGVELSSLRRGDWLADPRALAPTTRLDTRLRLRMGAALKTWAPVHVHMGTSHLLAHVVPLQGESLAAGESALAQLSFNRPVCAVPGDRFIVRDAQANHTIGGGVVLDPFAPPRKRRTAERFAYLGALEELLAGRGIAPLLQLSPYGVALADLARLTAQAPEALALPPGTRRIEGRPGPWVMAGAIWSLWRERVIEALRNFHLHSPEEPGPEAARLRRIAAPGMPEARWRALLEELIHEDALRRNGRWLHLHEHQAMLSAADEKLAHRLAPLLAGGGLDPPWVRELAASLQEPEERVRQVLRKQATRGALYQPVRDLFYDAQRMGELATLVAQLASGAGAVTAAQLRDASGLGRKRTIQLLEFFDRIGYTRRVRDAHVLRTEGAWEPAAAAPPLQGACAPIDS